MSTSSSSFHVFSDEGGGTEIQPVLGSSQPSLVIVPQWDITISTSPYASTLEADANAAIQFFESNFYEPATTTINITFSYGEILGQPIPSIYGAESRWGHSLLYTYAQIRNALSGYAATPQEAAAVNVLPSANADPTGGAYFNVPYAQVKVLGLPNNIGVTAGSSETDGYVALSTKPVFLSDPTRAVAAWEHEISEVMGRSQQYPGFGGQTTGSSTPTNSWPYYTELDLFRYSPSSGLNLTPGPSAGFFSIDGGNTYLNQFTDTQYTSGYDFADWAAPSDPTVVPPFGQPDAFGNLAGTSVSFSDIAVLDALGYHAQALRLAGQVKLTAATEHVALADSTTVATFADANTSDTASSFTATIDWGDGTTTSGTVAGSNGAFTVTGGHTYADEGSFPLGVTITDSTKNTLTLSGTVAVAEADVLTAHLSPSRPIRARPSAGRLRPSLTVTPAMCRATSRPQSTGATAPRRRG